MKSNIQIIIVIGLCITGCTKLSTPVPISMPNEKPELPTLVPSITPEPTATPKPSRTPIPKPTTTIVPSPMPTQMAILGGRWISKNLVGMNNAYIEFFPDGTYKMESVEAGKFQATGIFWFDENYFYIKDITGGYCGETVGIYEIIQTDPNNLEFMGWVDDCDVRWMTNTTSKYERVELSEK